MNRIKVLLLGAGQRALGVGDFGRGSRTQLGPGPYQPVILLRLGHRWARAVDPQPGGDQVAIGFSDLEGNGVRD